MTKGNNSIRFNLTLFFSYAHAYHQNYQKLIINSSKLNKTGDITKNCLKSQVIKKSIRKTFSLEKKVYL
jgi:hypothetical protein